MAARPVRARSRRPSPAPPAAASALRLLDALPIPAALLSPDGVLVAINPAWEAAATPAGLVSTRDEPGDDHLEDLESGKGFAREAGQAVAQAIRDAAQGQARVVTYHVETGAAKQTWQAHAEPVELEGEEFILLTHQDHTAQERTRALAEQLVETGVELKRSHAIAQDRANLLHGALQEFHGPMTPIQIQLHLLRGGRLGDLTDKQRDSLERIERNVRRWWSLQENLLGHLQSLERNGEPPTVVDVRALMDEAVPPFKDRSLAAGIRLRVDRPEQALPVKVTPRSLVQVLLLLIDHALRVTPSGGQVWVRTRAVGDHAEVSIQDQDPIMEPKTAQSLLDRAEMKTEHEDFGQALRSGLLYAHGVVRSLGGRLEVHCSAPGQGLEVVLCLPQSLGGA